MMLCKSHQKMGLYFLQNDHRKIALHKMRLFLGFIRERYYLATQELDASFKQQLSLKSEIPEKEIEKWVKWNTMKLPETMSQQ